MILPDVNLLIYATDDESEFHRASKAYLERILSSEQVLFSWHTITGFLRISTSPQASRRPLSIKAAVAVVDEWLALDNTHLINLEKKNWKLFSDILIDAQATGNLVMDAHLAAVSVALGAKLATTDRDFSRFPRLTTVNPFSKLSLGGR